MSIQNDLFGEPAAPSPSPSPSQPLTPLRPPSRSAPNPVLATAPPATRKKATPLTAQPQDAAVHALALALPPTLRLGTSSWAYPGWQGLVWEGAHSEQLLSKEGLSALAQHPLMRTVGVDRGFYRPLTVSQYERYASQVPEDFRFVVKAPSVVTDAWVRGDDGRGQQANPAFLDPGLAARTFVEPALAGLGHKVGVLVFQLSPLRLVHPEQLTRVLGQLRTLLSALPPLQTVAPGAVIAVEVRDPEWLAPDVMPRFAQVLRDTGATTCLSLHPKMPPLSEQLHLLRLLWPGPLVARWNLHPVHGAYGYADAERLYAPYQRMHDPDPHTHALLARTIAGVTGRGQPAYVTISNHAEGCAPRTLHTLAEHVVAACAAASPPQTDTALRPHGAAGRRTDYS